MPICARCRNWDCTNSTCKAGNRTSTKSTKRTEQKFPPLPKKLPPPRCCGEDVFYHVCDPVLVFGDTLRALLAYPDIDPIILNHARRTKDKDLPAMLFCREDLIYHRVGNARNYKELDAFLGHLLTLWTSFGASKPVKSAPNLVEKASRPVKSALKPVKIFGAATDLLGLDFGPTESAPAKPASTEWPDTQSWPKPATQSVPKAHTQFFHKLDPQLYENPFLDPFEPNPSSRGMQKDRAVVDRSEISAWTKPASTDGPDWLTLNTESVPKPDTRSLTKTDTQSVLKLEPQAFPKLDLLYDNPFQELYDTKRSEQRVQQDSVVADRSEKSLEAADDDWSEFW